VTVMNWRVLREGQLISKYNKMAEIDFTRYTNITEIETDIKSVKIQGATNVAIATFEGIKLFLKSYQKEVTNDVLLEEVGQVGWKLAYARANEPLAKNGLKYVIEMSKNVIKPSESSPEKLDTSQASSTILKEQIIQNCDKYLDLVRTAKDEIVNKCGDVLADATGLFTHCHSSTVEKIIINHAQNHQNVKVACTETEPLLQGRITAKNLVEAGLDVTMGVDSSAESTIIGRGVFPIDVVLLGADQITMQGDALNKIGSWGIALAAYFASKPLYIVTSILKVDPSTIYQPVKIEMRDAVEIWEEAPAGLKLVNPAFDFIDSRFITGYLTEEGLVKPEDIQKVIGEKYKWLV